MHGTAFAEVLDRALGAVKAAEPPVSPLPRPGPSVPPHPFLFATPSFRIRTCVADQVAPAVRPMPPPAATEPPRPARAMTAAERRAFDGLNALGARLAPDFGARELRSAFRALARRYHPDRHPLAPGVEKARLARTFAEINNHHQRLATLVEPFRH